MTDKPKLTTLEIEAALMSMLNVRINIVVPNVSWGLDLHECDLLSVTKSGYATEIEIKTSKADIIADKGKRHGHYSNWIKNLYFAVPVELSDYALEHIPKRAGLYTVEALPPRWIMHKVKKVKSCVTNNAAKKWDEKRMAKLAHLGAMRILGLKKIIAGHVRNSRGNS